MKRIQINEQYIKEIIKETLENLILGEEPKSEISLNDWINELNSMEFKSVDDIVIENDYEGNITLLFNKLNTDNGMEYNDDIYVTLYFEIIGDFEPYNAGDYFTEPSGGGYNLERIVPNHVTFETEDGNEEFEISKVQPEFKFLFSLLNKFKGEIEEKCAESIKPYEDDNSDY